MKNENKITLHPSSIKNWVNCRQQWYRRYILKQAGKTGSRAAVGTAIHAAAEHMWRDAMRTGTKNLSKNWVEYAEESFIDISENKDIDYGKDDDFESCMRLIHDGVRVYMSDIAPAVPIPNKVEERLVHPINDHPIVKEVAGTLDYVGPTFLADIKTSKTSPSIWQHSLQLSIYKELASRSGIDLPFQVHAIVFTKDVKAKVIEPYLNIKQVQSIINNLLQTLRVYSSGAVEPDILFGGNPDFYLCNHRFCDSFNSCKFSAGSINNEF